MGWPLHGGGQRRSLYLCILNLPPLESTDVQLLLFLCFGKRLAVYLCLVEWLQCGNCSAESCASGLKCTRSC
jgi:hypothetical protein